MVLKFKKERTRILMFIFVIALCIPAHAITYTAFDKATFDNSYQWSGHPTKDRATQWAQDIEALATAGIRLGTGKIWYVDSGSGRTASGDGTSWTRAFLTGDEAFASGKATADRGDIVLFAQGHNEALTAGGITVDVAGVRVYGIGNGTLTPTFDYDVNTGTFIISAANVTIANFRFRASLTGITTALSISATGDNASIINCDFGFAEAFGTDEFTTAITIATLADGVLVQGCKLNIKGAAQAAQGILLAAVSGFTLQDTDIIGDYSVACIKNSAAAQDVIIRRNLLFNGTMGGDGQINTQPALEMAELTSGLVADCRIVSDVTTALLMRVGDDMVFMNNFVSDTDGDEFSGTIATGWEASTTTISVSPHIDG